MTLVQVGQINGGTAELASYTQGSSQHGKCSQRPRRQSVYQTLRSLIPALPSALALFTLQRHRRRLEQITSEKPSRYRPFDWTNLETAVTRQNVPS